jgi:hypothetical protein
MYRVKVGDSLPALDTLASIEIKIDPTASFNKANVVYREKSVEGFTLELGAYVFIRKASEE